MRTARPATVSPSLHTLGVPVKVVWFLLALLLTSLTIGGLMSAAKDVDTVSIVGDLAISGLLGWTAVICWRRTRT